MKPHRLSLAGWLAAEDGIPPQAQQFYDLSEYERQAKEIEETEQWATAMDG